MIVIGAIKHRYIKSAAEKLVKSFPEKFTADFKTDKDALKELKVVESAHVRNKIAGSIVHLVRNKKF